MGIPLEGKTLYTLCFADVQILIAQDHDDVEYMTRKIIEEYRIWGLEVNIDKTRYMCIGGTQDLKLNTGQIIRRCEEYKYLGIIITRDGTIDKTIKERCTRQKSDLSIEQRIVGPRHLKR
jgi:hypothetical protein